MFLRPRKELDPAKTRAPEAATTPVRRVEVPAGVPIPGHLGELWHILQEIAGEEDHRFTEKSIVEHFNSCAEAQRDVTRWLNIYQRRVNSAHEFAFPPHWRRYRGFVLGPRNWPSGVLHEAFDATSWLRAPFGPAPTEEDLVHAVDRWLDVEKKNQKKLARAEGPSQPDRPTGSQES